MEGGLIMPEFILEGRDHAARAESSFVLGFIEAIFFTETDSDERTSSGNLPSDVGYTDLHPDSLAAIRADCEAWQAANSALLELALAPMSGYDETQAGRDYWLTRNHHGAGFWDRKELRCDVGARPDGTLTNDPQEHEELGNGSFLGTLGELLTTAAESAGEVSPFFGDHVTHGDSPFVHIDL
jgi:hypothetical protein